MMILLIMSIYLIMMILFSLNIIFQKKKINYREKMYPLECGFNQMNKFNLPFSIQFYYISILFLIFDIEISIILPMIMKMNFFILNKWMISFSMIISMLLIGLFLEWWNNLIKWN
uniref:NADH-ubiquinone oxidoreductase chain 3 n=1 Tax=Trissolcus basalis TaxID=32421 RepID=I3PFK6_9HYME|nr:NADH dehydrogenase subunit 3 [Trissolcus basalis]